MRISEAEFNQLTGKSSARNVRHVMREGSEQAALFDIVNRYMSAIPELRNITAVPMGDKRDARTAAILQSQGVRPGYPDILLDVARGGYHGLRVEMKTPGAKPTTLQREWHERLGAEGYLVLICYSAVEAWEKILIYLNKELKDYGDFGGCK